MKKTIVYVMLAVGVIFISCTKKEVVLEEAPVHIDTDEQEDTKALLKKQSEARVALFDLVGPYFDTIGEMFCEENGMTISLNPYKIIEYNLFEYSLDDQTTIGFYETSEGMFFYSLRLEGNTTSYFPDFSPITIGDSLQDAAALFGKADTSQGEYSHIYYNGGCDRKLAFMDQDDDQIIDAIVIARTGW